MNKLMKILAHSMNDKMFFSLVALNALVFIFFCVTAFLIWGTYAN